MRDEDRQSLSGGEDAIADALLRVGVPAGRVHPRAKQRAHRSVPVGCRQAVDGDDHVPDQRRTHALVRQPEAQLGLVSRAVFQDGPDLRADLLPLHVGGVRGHRHGEHRDQRGDGGLVSSCADRTIAHVIARRHEGMMPECRPKEAALTAD